MSESVELSVEGEQRELTAQLVDHLTAPHIPEVAVRSQRGDVEEYLRHARAHYENTGTPHYENTAVPHYVAGVAMNDAEIRNLSRRLRDVAEPIAGAVYFLPECSDRYDALGLDRRPAYFASRGACIGGGRGPVPGEVVVAAFGVFSPAVVIPAVAQAWSKTTAPELLQARLDGTVEGLTRILGAAPASGAAATKRLRVAADAAGGEGRHLFSGLRSLGWPGSPIGDLWRATDLVREHRGDSHIAAWISHGISPVEAQLLLELWWRMPVGPYTQGRGWTDPEIAASWDSLMARELVTGTMAEGAFTDAGLDLRASIEAATDRQERPLIEALGATQCEALIAQLHPWAMAVVEAQAYPVDPSTRTRL